MAVKEHSIDLPATAVVGTWRLLSFDHEDQATGEHTALFGQHPKGRAIFLDNGIMMGLMVADGRNPPTNDAERAVAFNTMVSYSGRWTIRGSEASTEVDISWNEAWTGTDQVRFIQMLGPNKMRLSTPWAPSPFDPSKAFRGVLDWERED